MSQRSCLSTGEAAMLFDPAPEEIEVPELSEGPAANRGLCGDGVGIAPTAVYVMICPCFLVAGRGSNSNITEKWWWISS